MFKLFNETNSMQSVEAYTNTISVPYSGKYENVLKADLINEYLVLLV